MGDKKNVVLSVKDERMDRSISIGTRPPVAGDLADAGRRRSYLDAGSKLGDARNALRVYETIVAKAPASDEARDALHRLIELCKIRRDWGRVARYARMRIDSFRRWVTISEYLDLGKALQYQGKYRDAIASFQEGIGRLRPPGDYYFAACCQYGIGECYEKLAEPAKAREAYTTLIREYSGKKVCIGSRASDEAAREALTRLDRAQ